jgi:KDO2-lipid IV(A) lauroyltransferase
MFHLFKMLSVLPLCLLNGMGWLLGWLAFLTSGLYRRRFLENAAQAGVSPWAVRKAIGEAGKLVSELPRIWLGRPVPVQWMGREHVDRALALGRGAVFLTPHVGSFEMAANAYAAQYGMSGHPLTVLFRPPRQGWLRTLVVNSRVRPGLDAAPTNLAGVKQMIKTLKKGCSVALLPDQVPPLGQGVWTSFFGREAYTMTLSARLALQTGAVILVAWGERLPWGRGFVVHVRPLGQELAPDVVAAAAQINHAMEGVVRELPQQYLWGYARYKAPKAIQ